MKLHLELRDETETIFKGELSVGTIDEAEDALRSMLRALTTMREQRTDEILPRPRRRARRAES